MINEHNKELFEFYKTQNLKLKETVKTCENINNTQYNLITKLENEIILLKKSKISDNLKVNKYNTLKDKDVKIFQKLEAENLKLKNDNILLIMRCNQFESLSKNAKLAFTQIISINENKY